MIPVLFLGLFIGYIVSTSFKDRIVPQSRDREKQVEKQIEARSSASPTVPSGSEIDLTPHLTEFTSLIRRGHVPNRWVITEAISEAFQSGNWKLARAIGEAYPSDITIERRKLKYDSKESIRDSRDIPRESDSSSMEKKETSKKSSRADEDKEEVKETKLLEFNIDNTTSPIDGITDDEWRMFVEASRTESPEFSTDKSIGMFRQNKKRIEEKLGIDLKSINTPVEQYNAFEKEIVYLLSESKELMNQSVAMPIDVDGETVPLSLSGLFTVMRNAGTSNAAKWIDSRDERRKFPHTTEAFKKCNGCF